MKIISKTEEPDKIPIPAYKTIGFALVKHPKSINVRPIRQKIIKQ